MKKRIIQYTVIIILAAITGLLLSRATSSSNSCGNCANCPSAKECTK